MNKIQFVVMRITFSLIVLSFGLPNANSSDLSSYSSVEKDVLKERIKALSSSVDLRYSEEVHKIVNTYINSSRQVSERLLGLSERYFPLYESEFAGQGLPIELKYLSVVESGLRPTVVSQAGAVGLWQFMKGTSTLYGLTSNNVVDERRDPIRSTQAATQYLKDLYNQFGDWTLALAAYNCGPGNVRRAMSRSSKEAFWEIVSYLPKETRRYIPKYVAISYMMSYWHVHGLNPVLDFEPNTLVTIRVYDYTKLSEVSTITGLDLGEVKELNPAFLKDYIPKSTKGYLLTLPEINMYNYLAQKGGWEDVIPMANHSSTLQYTYFRYGAMKRQLETILPLNTQRYSFKVQSVDINHNHSKKSPLPIEKLSIRKASMIPSISNKYHRLEDQQSLCDVSTLLGVSLQELLSINNIDIHNPPPAGSIIQVP